MPLWPAKPRPRAKTRWRHTRQHQWQLVITHLIVRLALSPICPTSWVLLLLLLLLLWQWA
jgi:hypothetical protein